MNGCRAPLSEIIALVYDMADAQTKRCFTNLTHTTSAFYALATAFCYARCRVFQRTKSLHMIRIDYENQGG